MGQILQYSLILLLLGAAGVVVTWVIYDLVPLFRRLLYWFFSSPQRHWSSLDYPTYLRRIKEKQNQIEKDRKNAPK